MKHCKECELSEKEVGKLFKNGICEPCVQENVDYWRQKYLNLKKVLEIIFSKMLKNKSTHK